MSRAGREWSPRQQSKSREIYGDAAPSVQKKTDAWKGQKLLQEGKGRWFPARMT